MITAVASFRRIWVGIVTGKAKRWSSHSTNPRTCICLGSQAFHSHHENIRTGQVFSRLKTPLARELILWVAWRTPEKRLRRDGLQNHERGHRQSKHKSEVESQLFSFPKCSALCFDSQEVKVYSGSKQLVLMKDRYISNMFICKHLPCEQFLLLKFFF